METTTTTPDDDEFAREIREAEGAEETAANPERAQRFYDRLRSAVLRYVEKKGSALGKTAEFLLLVPDVFILLWRLATDSRVGGKDKVLLVSALAYFFSPFDLLPEALLGPIGYLDDLVFAVYVLNKMLASNDAAIVREHWSGSEDVLSVIQRVLTAADSLVGSSMVSKIKKMMG
jgi:uncharacterized membrane protein YkvA (DUF1232 family)